MSCLPVINGAAKASGLQVGTSGCPADTVAVENDNVTVVAGSESGPNGRSNGGALGSGAASAGGGALAGGGVPGGGGAPGGGDALGPKGEQRLTCLRLADARLAATMRRFAKGSCPEGSVLVALDDAPTANVPAGNGSWRRPRPRRRNGGERQRRQFLPVARPSGLAGACRRSACTARMRRARQGSRLAKMASPVAAGAATANAPRDAQSGLGRQALGACRRPEVLVQGSGCCRIAALSASFGSRLTIPARRGSASPR